MEPRLIDAYIGTCHWAWSPDRRSVYTERSWNRDTAHQFDDFAKHLTKTAYDRHGQFQFEWRGNYYWFVEDRLYRRLIVPIYATQDYVNYER